MRHLGSLVVAVTAVLVFLTACGGEPSPPPGSADSPSPSATSSPPVAERPTGTLPIGCDVLVPSDLRAALFGADATTARPERTVALPSLWQGGLTECRWVTDRAEVRVWVLSEADDAYAEALAVTGPEAAPGVCQDNPEFGAVECRLQGLVAGYWFEASTSTMPSVPPAQLGEQVLATLEGALAEAGPPRSAWVPPATALLLPTDCTVLDGPDFRAAAGSPALPPVASPDPMVGSLQFELGRRSGELVCFWGASAATGPGQFELISFQGLTGSGWAWNDLRAAWEASGREIESLDVAGVDSAIAMCSPGHCSVRWLVEGTTAIATFQRYDESELERDRIAAVLESWVVAIRAAAG